MQIKNIYLSQIRSYYDVDLIKVLTGIRKCGKSFLLKQIIQELIENGIGKDSIIYINFEDFEYDEIDTAKKLHELLKEKMKINQRYYIFFDEIQHVNEFEKN